ncbi:MAG: pyruvate kinase [Candidatus Pacebacteria bacterium]|nr:pyruvate kinase [Candidatus Paceibacterota bacterium]
MKAIQEKKTKIVATIGPASRDKKVLKDMILTGLNVIRMNFSHGSHDDHHETLELVRSAATSAKKSVAILQDLSGPKIRVGKMEEDTILKEGDSFILTTKKFIGDNKQAFINYKKLPKEISKGAVIKLDDGKKELVVTKVSGEEIHTKVVVGGPLSSNKGVNFPDTELSISSLTTKDKKDVLFGIEHNVDYIALSFVQTAKDVLDLRKILNKHKSSAKIIAKIETTPAVKNIDEILDVADGAMVARGDMAVEVGVERVPLIQKMIIKKCNELGKPVITATQMLDSMEQNPVPTRAEVSDVANAILDGTDAIMLSGESAVGKYPVKSIETMSAIARRTEPQNKNTYLDYIGDSREVVDTISVSAVRVANNIRARLIVCLTESGGTARMMTRFRPHHGVIAITPHPRTYRELHMFYGCKPVLNDMAGSIDDVSKEIQKLIKKNKWALSGEKIVVTAGTPFGEIGSTNTVFVIEAK